MNDIEIHVRRKVDGKDVYPYTYNEDKRTSFWFAVDQFFQTVPEKVANNDWYVKKTYKNKKYWRNEKEILTKIQNYWWDKYGDLNHRFNAPFTPVIFNSDEKSLTNYLTFVGVPLKQVNRIESTNIDFEVQIDKIFKCLNNLQIYPTDILREEEFLYNLNFKRLHFCDAESWKQYPSQTDSLLQKNFELKKGILEYHKRYFSYDYK